MCSSSVCALQGGVKECLCVCFTLNQIVIAYIYFVFRLNWLQLHFFPQRYIGDTLINGSIVFNNYGIFLEKSECCTVQFHLTKSKLIMA